MTTLRVSGPADPILTFRTLHVRHVEAQTETKFGRTITAPAHDIFDFETILPMPAILKDIPASSDVSLAVEALTGKSMEQLVVDRNPDDPHAQMALGVHQSFQMPDRRAKDQERHAALTPAQLQMGARALEAIEQCGYPTWYEWCNATWGTKWNAYELEIVTDEAQMLVLRFQTAWSTPAPVFEKLALMYPDLTFTTDSYDEGGKFAAHGLAYRGEFHEENVPVNAMSYELAYGYPPDRFDDDSNNNPVGHWTAQP
jgi:hypothetical protein